ncbi:hypothetical protein OCU04_001816 [Sclerotinia nivalis]|uniref:ribonuclease H n=1 Tax=Sclerotinia nivalis TaxID=352851 RepID=A0A9X0AYW8_9HELO|nr:hypothetical protein OCU04_001816 [Sclerotinia nivalis]
MMLDQYLSRESRRDQNRSPEDRRIYSRKFDLHQYFSPASRNTKRFIYYDRLKRVSMVHDASMISGDPKTLVVAVDGACPHNGSDLATESSFGIFFGEGSIFNMYDTIERPAGVVHTNNYAELMAVYRALKLIKDSSFFNVWRADAENGPTSTAIIMTDSTYVYDSVTAWIWKWLQNNFQNAMGKPVVNGELIDRIDKTIFDLAERNICVRFWSVPREDNTEADELANRALIPGFLGPESAVLARFGLHHLEGENYAPLIDLVQPLVLAGQDSRENFEMFLPPDYYDGYFRMVWEFLRMALYLVLENKASSKVFSEWQPIRTAMYKFERGRARDFTTESTYFLRSLKSSIYSNEETVNSLFNTMEGMKKSISVNEPPCFQIGHVDIIVF